MPTLLELKQGESGVITKLKGRGAFRRRISEMGFIRGKKVVVIKSAPLQDPIEYKILGYNLSLRRSEAEQILVEPAGSAAPDEKVIPEISLYNIETDPLPGKPGFAEKSRVIEVALVGNPNCGKTTLFNHASGSRERVGNFSGVTVDSKEASFSHKGYTFHLTDLPGTYSLTAYSPEELFVRQHILSKAPDIVLNVVDASNLERNLFLTTQLIDMDISIVIALNMYDEFQRQGNEFDYQGLGMLLGIPVVPTVSSRGTGISDLFDRIIDVYEGRDSVVRHVHINYGQELEKSISQVQDVIRQNRDLIARVSSRYLSLKLLEKDPEVESLIKPYSHAAEMLEAARRTSEHLENTFREDTATLVTDAKYGFIAGALRETLKIKLSDHQDKSISETIDTVLTHKWLGFPVFILFLWLMFHTTFTLGAYPQDWIDALVGWFGDQVSTLLPEGPVKNLAVEGIINGVGSVIVFLPNILILFFFISLMEDTGYMARAAFIMDKLMHKIGLHGQSFIPLIMGFGCNVPAIMVTRTLKDRNDRLLTMLINPFMSCSARLPVYILLAGTVFPEYAGTVIFLLYLTGIVLAILISLVFKKTIFRKSEAPFVMELPPYRMPTMKVIIRHMWEKGKQYLSKMGGVILVAVILIWALGYFPAGSSATPEQRLEQSYIARIGKTIQPVIEPLGFDWRMGVSLITGAAAKEVVVSTMGVLFGHDTSADHNGPVTFEEKLRQSVHQGGSRSGEPLFTPLASASFLLFILIYMPCVAVIATVNRESGSWKWALFLMFYTTVLAWLLSFTLFQVGSLIL